MKISSALVLLLFVVAGCQQNPIRTACANNDWRDVGLVDGMAGLDPGPALEFSTNRCANAGASVDRGAYLAGHAEGLQSFCTTDNGNRLALNGIALRNICPSELAEDFSRGFDQGIKELCTPAGGKLLATRSRRYEGVCPGNSNQAFLQSYLAELDQLAVSARSRSLAAEAEIGEHALSIKNLSSANQHELPGLETKQTAAENQLAEALGVMTLAKQMQAQWGGS